MSVLIDTTARVLILGIGNLVMSDDGVGVKVVQKLQSRYRFPAGVEIIDGGTLGLDLLPMLECVERLIVVDAIEIGEKPGTCVRLSDDDIPIVLETKLSPHQMGFKDLLVVSRLMGHSPREMVLIGVQPGSIAMDTELTPEVEAQVEVMLTSVLKELDLWGITVETV